MSEVDGQSHAELRSRFESAVSQAGGDAAKIGDALFSFAELLDARPSVRRALTDTGRGPADREALLRRLTGDRLDATSVDLLAACVSERWAKPGELTTTIEEFGVLAHLFAARAHDRLDTVEEELFRFAQVVRRERDLRSALLDRAAPPEALSGLIRRLLDGRSAPETVRLVEHAVLERRAGSLESELERVSELAARLRARRVAVVHVAAPLAPEHRDRLERALSVRAGGPVQMNIVVEPGLVGGIKVELGDEVVDGTVASRLEGAQRQLVASTQ